MFPRFPPALFQVSPSCLLLHVDDGLLGSWRRRFFGGRMTMSCRDLPSSPFDGTWYFVHMEAYLLVRRRRFFETPSGRRLPSSRFSATSSRF